MLAKLIPPAAATAAGAAFILGTSLISTPAIAQEANASSVEQVVVTATRSGQGVRQDLIGSSITVLESVDLERRQTRIVSDILRDVPGVSVNRAGAVGGLTDIRVRGTESNQVLVLIDGMEASDPYAGQFDFATLIADDVARIEVLRGQQSALYGSDAIGGVIHYITGTGKDDPGFRTRIEGGSFGTWEGSARYAGTSGAFDYAVSAGLQTTDGVPTSRFGTRDVGSDSSVVSGKFEYAPTDDFRIRAVTRYAATKADVNDQDFSSPFGIPPYGYVVDSDSLYKNHAFYGLVRAELDSFEGNWRNALTLQGVDAGRNGYTGGALSYGDDGSRIKGSYESSFHFGSKSFAQTLTGAVDFKREKMQNTGPFLNPEQALERQTDNTGLVAQYDAVLNDRIGFGAAFRHDDNDRFENTDTYHLQASYRFDSGTRLHAAAGSGVKNPGFFELFGFDPTNFIGNAALKPERSEGWEAGVDQGFADDTALVGITYFDSTLHDEIFTRFLPNFVSSPANRTTDSTQKGIELYAQAHLHAWTFDVAYTYLDSKEDGVEEVRRPPNIGSVSIDWRAPEDRFGLNLTVRYNGETFDNNFTGVGPDRILLSEYTLVNLGGDYQVTDHLGVYARVENLLDENYEEVYTYRTAGRAAYLGFKASF